MAAKQSERILGVDAMMRRKLGASARLLFFFFLLGLQGCQTDWYSQTSHALARHPDLATGQLLHGIDEMYRNQDADLAAKHILVPPAEIPPSFWTGPIKALHPIKVYTDVGNTVIVQKMVAGQEFGKYIILPESSHLPQVNFVLTPIGVSFVYNYHSAQKGGNAVTNATVEEADTDGDGMPDKWEIAHGLKPHLDDSFLDPDGDGIPNLAEYKLHTDPHVPDNPLNLSSLQSRTSLFGIEIIPLQIDPTIKDDLLPLELYVDGYPVYAYIHHVTKGWVAEWDTTTFANGQHGLVLKYFCRGKNDNPAADWFSGNPIYVTVDNPLTFSSDTLRFWYRLNIDAQVNNGATSYKVDVYDALTSDYLTTIPKVGTGSVVNGKIQTNWDLTINGERVVNYSLKCQFYLYSPSSIPQGNNSGGITTNTASFGSITRYYQMMIPTQYPMAPRPRLK